MANLEIMAKANPVFQTAIGTTALLAKGGDPLAQEYLQAMELSELDCSPMVTGEERTTTGGYSFKLLNYVLTLEYRHKMMNQMIVDSGYPNVLDLACGYTPRAVRMSRSGIHYVGGDVPLVIQTMQRVIKPYRRESRTLMVYREVDVTNPKAMHEAADLLKGPICIVTEGLLGYLQDDEVHILGTNIREILQDHDGCWITMDPYYFQLAAAVAHALDESAEAIEQASLRGGASVSDTLNMAKLERNPVVVQKILRDCGLKPVCVPFYAENLVLENERFLPVEKRESFHREVAQLQALQITAEGNAPNGLRDTEGIADNFVLTLADGMLLVKLAGRIDAISAPELLQTYEKDVKKERFQEVWVEAEHLTYLSSTGLRVLLLMAKDSEKKKIRIRHANDTVKRFLAMNGLTGKLLFE